MNLEIEKLRLQERQLTERLRARIAEKSKLSALIEDMQDERIKLGQQITDAMESELASLAAEK